MNTLLQTMRQSMMHKIESTDVDYAFTSKKFGPRTLVDMAAFAKFDMMFTDRSYVILAAYGRCGHFADVSWNGIMHFATDKERAAGVYGTLGGVSVITDMYDLTQKELESRTVIYKLVQFSSVKDSYGEIIKICECRIEAD